MKVNVGSTNDIKVAAVRDAVRLYPNIFTTPEVRGVDVHTDLYGHPKNLAETIAGAAKRAKEAFTDCAYSFGLEGGLMEVPHSKTGFMEVGACAIYDGRNIHLGLSPAFEWPKQVTELIVAGKADASQAFKQLGLTEHDKLGVVAGGCIGFLSNGRLTREQFIKYSIIMALVQLERPELY